MKEFILLQVSLFRSHHLFSETFKIVSWFLSLMISAYLLINLSIPLYESSSHKGYVFATNNDGGRAIEVSMATRWYNSNHFAPYGNLYYRFSQSLADLIPLDKNSFSRTESQERSHHFALKIVSLFSLFGLGLFLGRILFGFTFVMPLFGAFFTLASINIPLWNEWIYRPHPEHILNLFTALAVYMFARFLSEKTNVRIFILSAFAWGLAMAVKRSTSIFIPGILILLLIPFNKTSLRKTLHYIGYMLFAYLVVGFPQNFGFYKHIKFMLYENSLHSFADLDSVTMNLKLVWSQMIYIGPAVLLGTIFSNNHRKLFSAKFLAFIALSFIPILMRKLSFKSDHHTMPLAIACMMLLLITVLHFLKWRISSRWFLVGVLILGIKLLGISTNYFSWRKTETACFKEFDQITEIISSKISPTFQLVKEPYFPSNEYIGTNTSTYWGLDWGKIGVNAKLIGITRTSLNQHLKAPPKDFYGKRLLNWEEKKTFYKQFENSATVTSPSGTEFVKAFNNVTCDYELWMAK